MPKAADNEKNHLVSKAPEPQLRSKVALQEELKTGVFSIA